MDSVVPCLPQPADCRELLACGLVWMKHSPPILPPLGPFFAKLSPSMPNARKQSDPQSKPRTWAHDSLHK